MLARIGTTSISCQICHGYMYVAMTFTHKFANMTLGTLVYHMKAPYGRLAKFHTYRYSVTLLLSGCGRSQMSVFFLTGSSAYSSRPTI